MAQLHADTNPISTSVDVSTWRNFTKIEAKTRRNIKPAIKQLAMAGFIILFSCNSESEGYFRRFFSVIGNKDKYYVTHINLKMLIAVAL